MKITEYLAEIASVATDAEISAKLNAYYAAEVPSIVLKIISGKRNGEFFDSDDTCRLLSLDEILNAETELKANFRGLGLIPLLDCGDNNFVCYCLSERNWVKFNVIDSSVFARKPEISLYWH